MINKTKFDKNAISQTCDIEMMFNLNRLKLDHINFKDNNLKKLDEKSSFRVKTDNECNLGKWIKEQESQNKPFTKTSNWQHLKEVHRKVHNDVQQIINNYANNNLDTSLKLVSELDKAVSDVFWTIQNVKKENCSHQSTN